MGPSKPGTERSEPEWGAFVSLPSRTLAADAASRLTWGSPDPNSMDTVAEPVLHGYQGISYDLAVARWVPAGWHSIAPDGLHYAYAEPAAIPAGPNTPTRIHVVDAATGRDWIARSAGVTDAVLEYAAEGIYLVTGRWEASPAGLRLLSPGTGAVRTIATAGAWNLVGSTAAWGFNGTRVLGDPMPDRIDRLDLATGAMQTWYSRPGLELWPIGLDAAGDPVVEVSQRTAQGDQPVELVVVTGRGTATRLAALDPQQSLTSMIADGHGLWFANQGSVFFYSPATGFRLAYAHVQVLGLAGTCR